MRGYGRRIVPLSSPQRGMSVMNIKPEDGWVDGLSNMQAKLLGTQAIKKM